MDFQAVEEHIEDLRRMASAVYEELKSGYNEIIYKEALMVELREAHIPYERERYVTIRYKGNYVIGTGMADIVTIPAPDVSIPIECKKSELNEDHRQQLRTYMYGIGDSCEHGVLIRFPQPGGRPGADALEFYWARREANGTLVFYRRDTDGIWVPDDGKKSRARNKKATSKNQSASQ